MDRVYLDSAATSRVREEVVEVMAQALRETYGNPSSTHSFGRTAKTGIEQARKTIAKELNAQASEIIFTSGGTEADNMILRSAVRDLGVKVLITAAVEHHAVLHTAEELVAEYGVTLKLVSVNEFGEVELDHLRTLLSKSKSEQVLVSLMHVNNEIGNLLDIQAVAELCQEFEALFHSDTVQSICHFKWDLQQTPIHFLTAAAHKFHGPKGVGFAYIRKDSGLKPLIFGGGQERGSRAGTESYHNIVGMEKAFAMAYAHLEEERAYVQGLKSYFITELTKAIPDVAFNGRSGELDKSTYTLVNLRLPVDAQKAVMLLFHLDLKGIACSKGSACQSGSTQGSHVLSAFLNEAEMQKPSLRFSFSKYNTKAELDYVVQELAQFVNG
jgi:cysteine desulfurase